jgi:hypothetical protein
MIEMIKLVRDIMITIAAAQLIVGYWIVMDAKFVGYWLANAEIGYYSIMDEYYADCDCTEELQ